MIGKLFNIYMWQITSKQYHSNYYDIIVKIGLDISGYKNLVGIKEELLFCFLGTAYSVWMLTTCTLLIDKRNRGFSKAFRSIKFFFSPLISYFITMLKIKSILSLLITSSYRFSSFLNLRHLILEGCEFTVSFVEICHLSLVCRLRLSY